MPQKRPIVALLLSLTIAILIARLAVVVLRTESGLDTIATQSFDAALAWTGLTALPLGERAPAEQAQYWLAASERAVEESPSSASLMMGAAWMLDSPSHEFMKHHIQQSDIAPILPQLGVELDEDAITKEKTEFRHATLQKCLEFAARATQIAPDDPRWWRMRAMLLFEGDSLWSGQDFAPRVENWLKILDDCIAHDGDNALYDYLAALALWDESAEYHWPTRGSDDRLILTIRDQSKFAQGASRFLDAQKRRHIAIGEEGYPAIVEFLEHSAIGKQSQSDAAVGRLVTFRQTMLFHHLWRWQQARADAASRANNSALALEVYEQSLRLFNQAIIPQETSALNTQTTFASLRAHVVDAIAKLLKKEPSLKLPDDFERLQRSDRDLRTETAALAAGLQEIERQNQSAKAESSFPSIATSVAITSSFALFAVGGLLLAIGTLIGGKSCYCEELGVIRQTLVWLIGCGGTFVVLGLAPAEVVSRAIQTRVVTVGVWLIAVGIAALATWFVAVRLRQRKLQFRITALFAAMTGGAVLAALSPLIAAACSELVSYPPELWLHARGWNGIEPEALRTAMKIDSGSWLWATIQWFAFNGLHIGLVLSLILCGMWLMWLTAKRAQSGVLDFWTHDIRRRWPALTRSLGKSSLYASAWMFLIYLCFAPQLVRQAEGQFQYRMSYCRDPHAHWEKIRDAQQAIENSPTAMDAIEKQVEVQLGNQEFLEQDFSRP